MLDYFEQNGYFKILLRCIFRKKDTEAGGIVIFW